ncbi:hypothetical protein [Amycolatopsis sp. NPDC059021]|uniref:hypothetical protein n=1 Tax=Amycolatopsis sp. NPDC059021 TaxID=3346704 RepID=UPI00366A5EEF
MTLAGEFALLGKEIRRLAEVWRELGVSVVTDRPAGVGLALADHLAEAVTDGSADLVLAVRAIEARPGAGPLHAAATALLRTRRRLDDEFSAYTPVSELMRAVRGRGAEWRGWAQSVRHGVDRCAEPLADAETAMLRCWREVGEVAELDKCGASDDEQR